MLLLNLNSLSNALARVTSSGRLIATIDGLRCVAVLAVLLYHLEDYVVHKHPQWSRVDYASNWFHRLLHVGNCGVPLFFSISGFILGLPWIEASLGKRQRVDVLQYFRRRVTRLEPPYLFNLIVMAVLFMLVKDETWSSLWPHLLISSCYLHGFVYGTMSTINGVAWSLEVEVQFYLVAPLLAALFYSPPRLVGRTLMLAVIAAIIVWKLRTGGFTQPHLHTFLPNFLDHFLVGMLLADIYAHQSDQGIRYTWFWDLVGIVGWVLVVLTQLIDGYYHFLALATLVAFLGTLRSKRMKSMLTTRAMVLIGGMCYTIYLYHFAIISAVGRVLLAVLPDWGYSLTLLVNVVVVVPVVLIISSMLFVFIEKPFMALSARGAVG